MATVVALLAACSPGSSPPASQSSRRHPPDQPTSTPRATPPTAAERPRPGLGGMPPVVDPANIYGETATGHMAPATDGALDRIYVPNGHSGTVTVIDPSSRAVTGTFSVGRMPQHVVPAYDLRRLWVLDNDSNDLVPIDPKTALPGPPVAVDDPYNLYFTPDGRSAIVVAEKHQRLDFRDPQSMQLRSSVTVPCKGLNHMDFTADGRTLVATCEFGSSLVRLDVATHRVTGVLVLDGGMAMPQDIRLSADGVSFGVADMHAGGVRIIAVSSFHETGFTKTGVGTHSIYPSRDGRHFYVANRGWPTLRAGRHGPGSVSVLDAHTWEPVTTWDIPGGGSPDMGNVSADGKDLWLSGRYDDEVYDFDTQTGQLRARIPVGHGPHGLTVWPQPGRYSLGHTGNMR